ncbi:MAG: hypothetical protein RL525_1181 [Bacteroidota bacterium]|jgi:hypothetical protein
MAGTVKIKKSKNLRFRLISVLYLLFISLSILQIPIEWFRINYSLLDYMNKSTKVELTVPEIKSCYDYIEDLDKRYLEALGGYDPATGKYNEPNGYSVSDVFFFKPGTGDLLFDKLTDLMKFYQSKPKNDDKRKQFEALFAQDLENGLADGKKKIYLEWKFKHGPANVVRAFLGEMRLRLKLLNGGLELKEEQGRDNIILMAYNIETVRPGDTVKIVVFGHEDMEVSATENGKRFELNRWQGDTLLFIPAYVGTYTISFKKNGAEESLTVTALPKGFVEKADHGFQTFYEGKSAELRFVNLLNAGGASCNCDPAMQLNKNEGKIKFTPNAAGWCKFRINTSDGMALLDDSVFVQQVPMPFILVEGSSDRSISLSRLASAKRMDFKAVHPEMPNFNYDITSMSVRLVGVAETAQEVSGSFVNLSGEQLAKLQYVVIDRVSVQTQVKLIQYQEPIVIQIKR